MKNSVQRTEAQKRRHGSQENNIRLNNLDTEENNSQQLSSKYFSKNLDEEISE